MKKKIKCLKSDCGNYNLLFIKDYDYIIYNNITIDSDNILIYIIKNKENIIINKHKIRNKVEFFNYSENIKKCFENLIRFDKNYTEIKNDKKIDDIINELKHKHLTFDKNFYKNLTKNLNNKEKIDLFQKCMENENLIKHANKIRSLLNFKSNKF